MSDRELLERAAKAAGIDLHVWGIKGKENFAAMNLPSHPRWNPLTDDGDAFRLAVKLCIDISFNEHGFCVYADECMEPFTRTPDQCAATRRAIVRAAAAMAKD